MRTTGWAILFCLLGLAGHALPWVGYVQNSEPVLWFDVPNLEPDWAFAHWSGFVSLGIFLLLLFFLIATGSLYPVPWWRSMVTALLTVAAFAFTVLTFVFVPQRVLSSWYGANGWFPHAGGVLALAAELGLFILASVEIRGAVGRAARRRPVEFAPEIREG